jgi:ABC-type bacteriocin/lantibiotic exporter with double-glycine peptidase domain
MITLGLVMLMATQPVPHRDPMLVNSEMNLYCTGEAMCGVTALYYALSEIGLGPSLDDILGAVPVGNDGTPLLAMCQYLQDSGVEYSTFQPHNLKVLLCQLYPGERAAILHVDEGTHFLTVKRTPDARIIGLDGKEIINNNVVPELESRFTKKALLIGKGSIRAARWMSTRTRTGLLILSTTAGLIIGGLWAGSSRKTIRVGHSMNQSTSR